jgi:hypothetical protein
MSILVIATALTYENCHCIISKQYDLCFKLEHAFSGLFYVDFEKMKEIIIVGIL